MEAMDLFPETLPRRPYSCNEKSEGLRIRSRDKALLFKHVQPNTPHMVRWLVFDVDRHSAGIDWEDRHVPPPTMVVRNRANGHAHLYYGLHAPVARTQAARMGPVRYLAAIEHALREALESDRGYAGVIAKNPLHAFWHTTEYGDLYQMDELAHELEMPTPSEMRRRKPLEIDAYGLGRNCLLFESLRHWAYREVREYWRPGGDVPFAAAVRDQADSMNAELFAGNQLPESEVKSTSRSVARWVWKRFNPHELADLIARTHTPAIQARRGKQKGARKREALVPVVIDMTAQGMTQMEIARELGISQKTVSNWLKASAQ